MLKIVAVFVGFYAFAGLVGGLQYAGVPNPGAAQLLFGLALLAGAITGFPTALWLWRRSTRAPIGLRVFGLAYLIVGVLIPFQGHLDRPWNAVLAVVLGGTGWVMLIHFLARRVARTLRPPAA